MVDPGEKVSVTLKREFMEEAMDSTMQVKKSYIFYKSAKKSVEFNLYENLFF